MVTTDLIDRCITLGDAGDPAHVWWVGHEVLRELRRRKGYDGSYVLRSPFADVAALPEQETVTGAVAWLFGRLVFVDDSAPDVLRLGPLPAREDFVRQRLARLSAALLEARAQSALLAAAVHDYATTPAMTLTGFLERAVLVLAQENEQLRKQLTIEIGRRAPEPIVLSRP